MGLGPSPVSSDSAPAAPASSEEAEPISVLTRRVGAAFLLKCNGTRAHTCVQTCVQTCVLTCDGARLSSQYICNVTTPVDLSQVLQSCATITCVTVSVPGPILQIRKNPFVLMY